jgi:hypothetical protein
VRAQDGQSFFVLTAVADALLAATMRLRVNPWWLGTESTEAADGALLTKLQFLLQLCEGQNFAMQVRPARYGCVSVD